jgi:hypothetical protein
MTQSLVDEVPQHLRDFIATEAMFLPDNELDAWDLIFYKALDPEYVSIAHSHYWDTATDYAIFRVDRANSGLVVCARYPRLGWIMNPGNYRDLVRILLGLSGVELPMPLMRGES